jgi:hypothetical protein
MRKSGDKGRRSNNVAVISQEENEGKTSLLDRRERERERVKH